MNQTLTSLDISLCSLGSEGMIAIAKALEKSNLLVLKASQNEIGDEGAKALADLLSQNTPLQELEIERKQLSSFIFILICAKGNKIGTNGAQEIISALQGNKNLTRLDFAGNYAATITDGLLELLRVNHTITSLDISGKNYGINSFLLRETIGSTCSDNAITRISRLLSKQCYLKELKLNSTNISKYACPAFASFLRENTTLTTLELSSKSIFSLPLFPHLKKRK